MEEVTRKELVRDLKALGLFAGIKIMVHSSLKAFRARVEGGPQTVIQAIMEVVTPEGKLSLPTSRPPYGMRNVNTSGQRSSTYVDSPWSEQRPSSCHKAGDAIQGRAIPYSVSGILP